MFSEYQCISAESEDDSSYSQTLSFPGAFSVKKKAVPLHRRERPPKIIRDLKPLNILDIISPNVDLSNTAQEREIKRDKIVDNSLGNIQEVSENKQISENVIPENHIYDPLEDLFPSKKVKESEFSGSLGELHDWNSTSQMNTSGIHVQDGQKLEVVTPEVNKITVLEDIGNQRNILNSKIKSDIKKTPVCPNWNRDINTVSMKQMHNKENILSSCHSKSTPAHKVFFTPLNDILQPTSLPSVVSNQLENKNIPSYSNTKRKLQLQTPDRILEDVKSEIMMPPPSVPQIRLTPEEKSQHIVINRKNYAVQFMLGRGGSSKVYQVLDPKTSCLLAVKEVDLSMGESSITKGYLQEIDLLRKLQGSESVIKMIDYEYIEKRERLYVVMEKGETDLSRLIKEITRTKPMPISTIVHYWIEMLRAVKDIHAKNVIHSDLKPANFLLVCGRLKLIDFGIASSVQNDMTSVYKDVQTGTYNYISPEALQGTSSDKKGVIRISYKSDIWSLGCILYNLLFGKTPFQHIVPHFAKLATIGNKNHCIEYPSTRNDCPPVLLYAVKKCLTYDPKKRPTAASLLELPYFNPNATGFESFLLD